MTSPSHPDTASSPGSNADARERCLLYLLGELTDEQAAALERELEQSKQLQDDLVWQSRILCDVSRAEPSLHVASVTPYPAWRAVATIAAVAACLMIAFLSWPDDNERGNVNLANATPEAVLIAQAWAEKPLSDLVGDWNNDQLSDAEVPLFSPDEDDSSLSWMVAAAEAGVIIDG